MARTTGRITIAQEERFVLEEDSGSHRLFLLSHGSNLNPDDLSRIANGDRKVSIDYSEPDHLIAAVAHHIDFIDADDGRVDGSRQSRPGHSFADTVKGFLNNWSLPRQIAGASSRSDAAKSTGSARLRPRLEEADKIGTSICGYCAVGCAQLVYAKDGKLIHVEGDPRSPINQGTLCPKGAATLDLLNSPLRLNSILYRAPGSDHWEKKSLDWAMDRIARLMKKTRDESFVTHLPNGKEVNHTLAMASLGGATLDNEENYLIKKLYTAMGAVQIENQARI